VSPLVTTTGPADLAHLVHYGIVAAGIAGVTALLLPAVLERAHPARQPVDEHDRRIGDLRERVSHGDLARPAAQVSTGRSAPVPGASGTHPGEVLRPVVVISSLAAAGVHAAVAPPHLREGALIGAFFVLCALAQLAWAAMAWQRPTPTVLWTGILGNLAVLALWLVSRTVGIPGIAGGPEPVGPWDVTCALWEVVVVVGCLRMRNETAPVEPRRGAPVHPFVVFWLVLSVLGLGLLSVSGAAA
jgi:hypothetical protein